MAAIVTPPESRHDASRRRSTLIQRAGGLRRTPAQMRTDRQGLRPDATVLTFRVDQVATDAAPDLLTDSSRADIASPSKPARMGGAGHRSLRRTGGQTLSSGAKRRAGLRGATVGSAHDVTGGLVAPNGFTARIGGSVTVDRPEVIAPLDFDGLVAPRRRIGVEEVGPRALVERERAGEAWESVQSVLAESTPFRQVRQAPVSANRVRPTGITAQMRLTDRGWWVLTGLAFLVSISLGVFAATVVNASAPEIAVADSAVIVSEGDTLWGIASSLTPTGADVRDTVILIQELNELQTSQLTTGQRLAVPAQP